MKYITGIALFWFCLIFMVKNTNRVGVEEPKQMIAAVSPEMCVCFEYYFNNLKARHRTIYQTCDQDILDYNEDKTLELFTLNIPCDSVFQGTRIAN